MNIEELTIGQVREICNLFGRNNQNESHSWEIDKNYFIRTVTFHLTGKLIAVHDKELVLIDAAWIADNGRFADAIKNESFTEVEPFPDDRKVIVGRGSILDATIIKTLPRSQK